MTNRTMSRSLRRAMETAAIVSVATLAGARTAEAQLRTQPGAAGDASYASYCNPQASLCNPAFVAARPWTSVPVSGFPGIDEWQAAGRSKSYWLIGALGGFVVGATATYFVLHSGGSTSKCDRDANQDALSRGECTGLVVLGGLVGAGAGALIGSRIRSDRLRFGSFRGLDVRRMPNGRMTIGTAWLLW